jgi:hypothetical protein
MRQVAAVLAALVSFLSSPNGAAPQQPRPVATFALSQLLPGGSAASIWGTVAFVSDDSVAVGVCRAPGSTECSLSLIRAKDGVLRPFAETRDLHGMQLHRFPGGQIVTVPSGEGPATLYSANLSAGQTLFPLSHISSSGGILAASTKDGWTLFDSKLAAIRSGKGSLRSVSDEVVVFQSGVTMRVEATDGKPLGAFPVRSETKCYNTAEIAGDHRLYLDNCKSIRMVDFSGKIELTLQRPKGYCDQPSQFDRWSADRKRVVFDCSSHKVSFLRGLVDFIHSVSTLGMCCEEWGNREEVRVVDATNGKTCFDWIRPVAMGSEPFVRTTAISPSGELVAILADGLLAVYRVPAVCSQ